MASPNNYLYVCAGLCIGLIIAAKVFLDPDLKIVSSAAAKIATTLFINRSHGGTFNKSESNDSLELPLPLLWFTFALHVKPKTRSWEYGIVAPLAAYGAKRNYKAEVFVLLLSEGKNISVEESFVRDWLIKAGAHVLVVPVANFDVPNGTLQSTIAQTVRLCNAFYPVLSDKDYLITMDADILPYNLQYLPQIANVTAFTLWQYYYASTSADALPIVYVGAMVKFWKEAFGNGSSSILGCISKLLHTASAQGLLSPCSPKLNGHGNPQWFTDQDILAYVVAQYCNLPIQMKSHWWASTKKRWKVPMPPFGPLKSQCAGSRISHIHQPIEIKHGRLRNDWHIVNRRNEKYLSSLWTFLYPANSTERDFFDSYMTALRNNSLM